MDNVCSKVHTLSTTFINTEVNIYFSYVPHKLKKKKSSITVYTIISFKQSLALLAIDHSWSLSTEFKAGVVIYVTVTSKINGKRC